MIYSNVAQSDVLADFFVYRVACWCHSFWKGKSLQWNVFKYERIIIADDIIDAISSSIVKKQDDYFDIHLFSQKINFKI